MNENHGKIALVVALCLFVGLLVYHFTGSVDTTVYSDWFDLKVTDATMADLFLLAFLHIVINSVYSNRS